jgi:phosphate transport system protein
MTRVIFEKQLNEIQQEMLLMGTMVTSAIERSIQALKERDADLARRVISDDMKINQRRYDIEHRCQELVATQQPLAGDLRAIFSVLHIIVDLERMGDHAEGIAKIAIMLADEPQLKPYIDIPRMAQIAIEMLTVVGPSVTATKNARVIVDQTRGRRPLRPGLPRASHS